MNISGAVLSTTALPQFVNNNWASVMEIYKTAQENISINHLHIMTKYLWKFEANQPKFSLGVVQVIPRIQRLVKAM